MTDIVALLGDLALGCPPFQPDRAGNRRQIAGHRPQQCRLSRPVGTGQQQRLAGPDLERKVLQNQATAAFQGQTLAQKLHCHPAFSAATSLPRKKPCGSPANNTL